MGVEFKKLSEEEQKKLRRALDANALSGEEIRMDKETTFTLDERKVEESLVDAIKSVPVHY